MFERIHHYSSSATIRHCLQSILHPTKAGPEFKWKNSSLPSALADPLPLLAKAGVTLRRAIQRNERLNEVLRDFYPQDNTMESSVN
jgi:hypothetical protein